MAAKKKEKIFLTEEESTKKREELSQKRKVIHVFESMGFDYLKVEGDQTWPEELRGYHSMELDFIFLYESIIVSYEITRLTGEKKTLDHFRGKLEKYQRINRNKDCFIKTLKSKFPDAFERYSSNDYQPWEYNVFFIYHPKEEIQFEPNLDKDCVKIVDDATFTYFQKNVKSIRKSAKYEFFDFLGLKRKQVLPRSSDGEHTMDVLCIVSDNVAGIKGVKTVTFMARPEEILECAYVMRKGSWREEEQVYQRLLINEKLKSMREYISIKEHSFLDSITISLPKSISFHRAILNGKEVATGEPILIHDPGSNNLQFVRMNIPREYNTIGIIDGQHRVFSYHEASDKYEECVKKRRKLRCLLVTGLIFQEDCAERERTRIESETFITLNSKQKKPDTQLLQHIEQYKSPYGKTGLAIRVLTSLNSSGALRKKFNMGIDDSKKIKTVSVVKYALSNIVDISNPNDVNSFYYKWKNEGIDINTDDGYMSYVQHCSDSLNTYFEAIRCVFNEEWKNEPSKILSSHGVTGIIKSLSHSLSLEEDEDRNFSFYEKRLKKLKDSGFYFDQPGFVSSHWGKLADAISDVCWEGYKCQYPEEHGKNQKLDQ